MDMAGWCLVLLWTENKEAVKTRSQRALDWSMEPRNVHPIAHWEKRKSWFRKRSLPGLGKENGVAVDAGG